MEFAFYIEVLRRNMVSHGFLDVSLDIQNEETLHLLDERIAFLDDNLKVVIAL
jgi:hypothetical protein